MQYAPATRRRWRLTRCPAHTRRTRGHQILQNAPAPTRYQAIQRILNAGTTQVYRRSRRGRWGRYARTGTRYDRRSLRCRLLCRLSDFGRSSPVRFFEGLESGIHGGVLVATLVAKDAEDLRLQFLLLFG